MMKKIILLISAFFFYSGVNAQLKTVTGRITIFEEIPLQDATIIVKSSGRKFSTDTLGKFSIECETTDQLKVSAAGFSNRNVRIKEETKFVMINLNLLPKENAKELAVGYGHVKDKTKLYAMAGQNQNKLNYSQYNNIYEILTGNFPGVQIVNGEVIVRASATFTGNASALLIVDGRQVNSAFFAALHPADIAPDKYS